jgi:hypothetical protein
MVPMRRSTYGFCQGDRSAVHEPLARHILEASIERGFDLAYSEDMALDYAFYVPLHFAMPE